MPPSFPTRRSSDLFMTGGQLKVPVVIRACSYYGNGTAAQHADRPWPFFMNVPGLKVVAPATATDAKGLLKSAIRDDDPVLMFEEINLWSKRDRTSTRLNSSHSCASRMPSSA